MAPMKRYAKKQAKAIKRRRLNAQQRLRQQRAQAQRYIEAIHQALEDVGFPDTLVAEIEGRLQAQQQLLKQAKTTIISSMCGGSWCRDSDWGIHILHGRSQFYLITGFGHVLTELLQFGTQCANLRTENHQTATICGWLHLQPRQRGDPVDDPPHSGTSRLGSAWNVAHRDESARGTVTTVVFCGSHPCLSQGASMDSSSNRYFCGYKPRAPNSR